MKASVALLACVLCAAPVAFAQQYGDESRDSSYSNRDDSGAYSSRDSGAYSSRDSKTYSSRDSEAADWYGDRERGMRDDSFRDRWSRGQYDTGRSYGRSYDRDYGYYDRDRGYGSQYGYRGTEDWSDRGYGQDWGQRGQFRGEGWRDDMYERRMGRADRLGIGQSVAIIGQLTKDDATLGGVNPSHKLIEMRTQSGSTLFVDLGPDRQQIAGLDLSPNQSFFARGHLVNVSGERVLLAREIARVSQRVTLFRGAGQQNQDIFGYTDDKGVKHPSGTFGSETKADQSKWDQSKKESGQSSPQSPSGQSSSQNLSGQSSSETPSGHSGSSNR